MSLSVTPSHVREAKQLKRDSVGHFLSGPTHATLASAIVHHSEYQSASPEERGGARRSIAWIAPRIRSCAGGFAE
jgi:hypothetical protein